MIQIDLRTDLPKVRAAFDAGELQAQTSTEPQACVYDGPCAVGAMVTEAQRLELDGAGAADSTIMSLVDHRAVEFETAEQAEDAQLLQRRHDAWAFAIGTPDFEAERRRFERTLSELEAKYA